MRRDPDLLLEDMLDALREVAEFTRDCSRLEFEADARTFDAVVRDL